MCGAPGWPLGGSLIKETGDPSQALDSKGRQTGNIDTPEDDEAVEEYFSIELLILALQWIHGTISSMDVLHIKSATLCSLDLIKVLIINNSLNLIIIMSSV